MPIIETILLGMAASGAYDLTKEGAKIAYQAVLSKRPDLIEAAESAAEAGDDQGLRTALTGAFEVLAGAGEVSIDGAVIEALRQATFDHQQGTVVIAGTQISAPVLVTGGGSGAKGKTVIGGGTSLSSAGTKATLTGSASITLTGNAQIKQD